MFFISLTRWGTFGAFSSPRTDVKAQLVFLSCSVKYPKSRPCTTPQPEFSGGSPTTGLSLEQLHARIKSNHVKTKTEHSNCISRLLRIWEKIHLQRGVEINRLMPRPHRDGYMAVDWFSIAGSFVLLAVWFIWDSCKLVGPLLVGSVGFLFCVGFWFWICFGLGQLLRVYSLDFWSTMGPTCTVERESESIQGEKISCSHRPTRCGDCGRRHNIDSPVISFSSSPVNLVPVCLLLCSSTRRLFVFCSGGFLTLICGSHRRFVGNIVLPFSGESHSRCVVCFVSSSSSIRACRCFLVCCKVLVVSIWICDVFDFRM